MLILGFGHRARQGKSLCAEAVQAYAREKGLRADIYSLGDEVLAHCHELGLIPTSAARKDLSAAQLELLARVGLEERIRDEDIWIDRLFTRIEREDPQVALIPNLRYPNEANRVNAEAGMTVLVERFNIDGSHYIAPDRDPNHPSETGLEGWCWNFRLAAFSGQWEWLQRQAWTLFEYAGG